MTLTAVLPTLRRSIPDPLRQARWPDHTETTTTDVAVDAVSLFRLAGICSTPCVHTAEHTVGRDRHGRVIREDVTVVLTHVLDSAPTRSGLALVLDADLSHVGASWPDARLLGRASTAAPLPVVLAADPEGSAPLLPGDIARGDLLAVPCSGLVVRRDIRRITERGTMGR